MFKHLLVASVLSLLSCAVGSAEKEAPILRAKFNFDTYSNETGLLTRIMCDGKAVSVSAPIPSNVLSDITTSALASDLFSIDTSPEPLLDENGQVLRGRVLTVINCSYYWFEISVGGKVNRIDWNCESLRVGERKEIRQLKRALEPFIEKLPRRCPGGY